MGEAKRRKNIGTPIPSLDSAEFVGDMWTAETGVRLATLCGLNVVAREIGAYGMLALEHGIDPDDRSAIKELLLQARRVRTRPEYWPQLIQAVGLVLTDRTFLAFADRLRRALFTLEKPD
jgi:hypothetical protein